MELKKLHMGTIVFGWDAMDEVSHMLSLALEEDGDKGQLSPPDFGSSANDQIIVGRAQWPLYRVEAEETSRHESLTPLSPWPHAIMYVSTYR